MPVRIWEPTTPLPSAGHVYFRPADEPAIKAAIEGAASYPLTVRVKPNGEKHLGLIHAHIVGSSRGDFGWIGRTDFGHYEYPTRSILERGAEIVSGLTEHSSERIGTAALALEHLIAQMAPERRTAAHNALYMVAGHLAQLCTQCLATLEHGSPFIQTVLLPHNQNRSWWLQVPSVVGLLRSQKLEILKSFGTAASKQRGLAAIDAWLTEIAVRIERLSTKTKGQQVNDTLLEASAYCAALAERYLLRGNSALAVLLLHRSADLCLLRLCSQNKCIDWTVHGGKYLLSVTGGKDARIALSKSVELVEDLMLLAPDPNRPTAFLELNDWRNLLIQGHYLSDVSDGMVRSIFKKIRPYLDSIGGAQWKSARDCYLGGVRLSLSDLLDIDGSLTGTFDIVHLAA